MSLNAVDLAAELIRFDTVNPPGQEAACTEYLARLLTNAGFQCETVALETGRPNLVARIAGIGGRRSPLPVIPIPSRSVPGPGRSHPTAAS
jgi:succinyl-diaminopimelate desuccinylase